MKVMPASWDDLVIPKVIGAVWHKIRQVDWRASAILMLLAVTFIFAYVALGSGAMWVEIYASDPFKYPGVYGAMMGDCLAFLSLGLITLTGVTSAAWARHACRPSFDVKKITTRLLLAIHIVLLSSALISTVGVYLYIEWWRFPTYITWLPTSFLLVVLTAAGLIAFSASFGTAWRNSFLAKYLPLIHQACVLWLLIVFYGSTIGNTVDLIK